MKGVVAAAVAWVVAQPFAPWFLQKPAFFWGFLAAGEAFAAISIAGAFTTIYRNSGSRYKNDKDRQ